MEYKYEIKMPSSGKEPEKTESTQIFNFGNLPGDDIKSEIGKNPTPTTLNSLAMTSREHYRLFSFKSRLVTRLVECTAWGQQDKIEKLLTTSPELMIEKTNFTDCSGRTFSNISAFEFTLWALDTRYMVAMMFNCLHMNKTGIKLAAKLQEQYAYHKKHGVTYHLDGQTITENHFDLSVLKNALHAYVNNFDNWTLAEREKHWCTVVGKAQCYLPAHIMQHFCEPNVPFFPKPDFEAEQFKRSLEFCIMTDEID